MKLHNIAIIVVLLLKIASGEQEVVDASQEPLEYGVDVSFPAQHAQVTENQKPFGDSIMPFYDKFMQGCRNYYEERAERCDESELSRLNLNLRQPPVMQVRQEIPFTY